ncbi:MAG: hypothetical protein GEU83_14565 [Pseudonocardiaceae bacterium]|nr:hypothetical protein [Pseudonocardiaceae bacterium]
MEIIMTAGTGSLALAGYGWQPARTRSLLRTPCLGARSLGMQLLRAQLSGTQRHLVKFHNPVAPIGTDVPVAGRMRVSAPEP